MTDNPGEFLVTAFVMISVVFCALSIVISVLLTVGARAQERGGDGSGAEAARRGRNVCVTFAGVSLVGAVVMMLI